MKKISLTHRHDALMMMHLASASFGTCQRTVSKVIVDKKMVALAMSRAELAMLVMDDMLPYNDYNL